MKGSRGWQARSGPTSGWIQAGCHLLRGAHIPPAESRKVGIEVEFDHGSLDMTPLIEDDSLSRNDFTPSSVDLLKDDARRRMWKIV